MTNTRENLQEAFAGESQANRRYIFFAESADKTGEAQLARLFRAAAEAETVHARNHFRVLGNAKTNKDNLNVAISGEHHEFSKMYPEFIDQANSENNAAAVKSFDLANQVEKIHHNLFQGALKNIESGKEMKTTAYYVCQVCGNTVENDVPDRCPICGAPRGQFKKIE